MKDGTLELTQGKPIKQILLFSIPLVAGTLFQQIYSFADTIMVGRLIGTSALAAVGATYPLSFLILGFVQGACVGFGIPLAESFGAKSSAEFKRYFWNGVWVCFALSFLLTILTVSFSAPLLKLIQTPEDIFSQSAEYAIIIFLGIPASFLYNFSSCSLRAAGDSRHPFYFLLFSSFLNIGLDWFFIKPLNYGVRGAAIATVLSQAVSAGLNTYWLFLRTSLVIHSKAERRPSRRHIKRLCIMGFPMGLEYCVSALGAVAMQWAVNLAGSVAVAGQTAGEKIRQMFTLPMESVGMAMATYTGQNMGAKRFDRILKGIKSGIIIQWTYCIFAWILIFFGKRLFTQIVLGSASSDEAAFSIQYLSIISVFFFLHGGLMVMRNTLQGMGYSLQAVLSGVGELFGRTLGGILSLSSLGFIGIALANPFAFLFSFLYCSILVFLHLRKKLA